MLMHESIKQRPVSFQNVPPVAELRQRASKRTWEQPWHALVRKVSIYATWLLLHTPISANGVTALFLASGVLAGVIFALGTRTAWIVGTIFIWLSILMDFSDGEVARFRQQGSWFGDYFEETVHSMISTAMYIGISIGVWRQAPENPWIFLFAMLALGSTQIIRSNACLIMKAKIHFYGPKRQAEIASAVRASKYSPTANLNRPMALIGMVIFDLGIYFLVLPVMAVLDRMDIFLYFYGITRSVAAAYIIFQTWTLRNSEAATEETLK
jgi:phosphatidylglycerophosphate synthase